MKQRLTRRSKNCRLFTRKKTNIQSAVPVTSVLRTWIHTVLVFCPLVLHFCFNTPLQSTLLLNLHCHIFCWTLFGWLRNWTLPEEYNLPARTKLAGSTTIAHYVTVRFPFTTDDVYSYWFKFLFLPTNASMTHTVEAPKKENNADTMVNYRNNNFNGMYVHQPQWPRRLRRRSAAARLLVSWVPVPQGHGSLSWVLCVFRWSGWSLVQSSPTNCGASFCMI